MGPAKLWTVRTEVQVLPNPYDQRPRRIFHRFRIFTNRPPRIRPRNPSLIHKKASSVQPRNQTRTAESVAYENH